MARYGETLKIYANSVAADTQLSCGQLLMWYQLSGATESMTCRKHMRTRQNMNRAIEHILSAYGLNLTDSQRKSLASAIELLQPQTKL